MDPLTEVNENISLEFKPSAPSTPSASPVSFNLKFEAPAGSPLAFPSPVAPKYKHHKRLSLINFMPPITEDTIPSAQPSTPGEPFDPKRVSTLDLAHTKITSLSHLAANIHLYNLNVSYTELFSLAGLEQLCHLQVLNIEGCGLSELTFSLRGLRTLRAANNAIELVELDCPHLEYLDLDNNRVGTLTPLPSVRELRVRNNYATLDLQKWSSLSILYAEGNTLLGLENHRLRMLSWDKGSINAACLANAQIALCSGPEMPAFSSGVYPIQHLALCGLGLTKLPSWFSRRLPCLQVLDLSDNQLDNSAFSVLSHLSSLRALSLAQNNINELDELYTSLCPLGQLGVLDVRDNPLTKSYYADGKLKTIQPLIGIPYVQYHKLLKSLGIWWLDGLQIAHGSPRRMWHNDILLDLASVLPTQSVWASASAGGVSPGTDEILGEDPGEDLDEQARVILEVMMKGWRVMGMAGRQGPSHEWLAPGGEHPGFPVAAGMTSDSEENNLLAPGEHPCWAAPGENRGLGLAGATGCTSDPDIESVPETSSIDSCSV